MEAATTRFGLVQLLQTFQVRVIVVEQYAVGD